jgi:phosphatidylserine/phosphatidylglycerophosphate/cardiolipin synthase-like enzyme
MKCRTLGLGLAWLLAAALAQATPGEVTQAPPRAPAMPEQATVADQQVELVETVPVEAAIGNPALRSAHDVWVEAVRGARSQLDLEEFYLSDWPGEPLGDVLREIRSAAYRGVRVRLLLDAKMSRTYPHATDSLATLPGVQVRFLDVARFAGGGVQHAKFFLVDQHGLYLGSQNLDWRALKHIHELGAWILDYRVARVFQEVFEQDWERADPGTAPGPRPTRLAGQPWYRFPFRLEQPSGEVVELWPSYNPLSMAPDSALWDRDAVVRLLDSARSEIVVQVLTYSTGGPNLSDDTLDRALRRAAQRGVKVKMVVSDWGVGARQVEALRGLARVPNVEVRVSTVPEWSGGYIPFARVEHCKYVVVDTAMTWVGTSNWEPDYFLRSRNIAVTLGSRSLAAQARAVFEATWKSPIAAPLKMEGEYPRKEHGETPPPGAKKYGG